MSAPASVRGSPPARGQGLGAARLRHATGLLLRLLAAITVLAVAGGFVFHAIDLFRNQPAAERFGVTFAPLPSGAVQAFAGRPPAATTPLGRVVRIGSTALPRATTVFDVEGVLARAGAATPITVNRADGRDATVLAASRPEVWGLVQAASGLPLWLTQLVVFVQLETPPVALLWAALLLVRRRPHDPEAVGLAFCFLLLCYSVENWITHFGAPGWLATSLYRAGLAGVIVAIAAFPDGRLDGPLKRVTAALALASLVPGLLVLGRTDGFATGLQTIQSLMLYGAIVLAAATLLLRYVRLPAGVERQQFKWVFIAAALTAACLTVVAVRGQVSANVSIPASVTFLVDQVTHLVFTLALPAGMLVAILRYRLYDSDAAMTRSAAYLVLSASLAVVFAATLRVVSTVEQDFVTGQLGSAPAAIATALTALAFAPVEQRVKRLTERAFRKNLFDMRERLPVLVGDLRETCGLRQLAQTVTGQVRGAIHSRAVAIVSDQAICAADGVEAETVADWMAAHPLNPAATPLVARKDDGFPLRLALVADGVGPVGWLLVGPRPDGSFFGGDERRALKEIAGPVARAIAIVRQREQTHAAEEEARALVAGRLAELEASLERLSKGR